MPITDSISVFTASSPAGIEPTAGNLRAAVAADDAFFSTVVIGAAATQIAIEDGDRVMVMFAIVGGVGTLTWGFTSAMATSFGITATAPAVVVINRNDFGSLASSAIWVAGAGLTVSVTTLARRRPLATDRPRLPLIRSQPVLAAEPRPVAYNLSNPFGRRAASRWIGSWR